MRKILITGASGFIGKALLKEYLNRGEDVIAVVRDKNKISEIISNKLTIIEADCSEYLNLDEKICSDIDIIYHCAFKGSFGAEELKNYKLQLENTEIVCDLVTFASKVKAKRIVFTSTINEIEVIKYLSQQEIQPRSTCIYSTGKIASEMMGKTIAYNSGVEFVSGLVAMPYGPGNTAKTLPNILMKKFDNNEVPKLIEGNNKYDLVFIDDVVRAFIAIGELGINQKSYYVGHRKLHTFKEIVTELKNIVNPELDLVFGEFKDNLDLDYSVVDIDELFKDTGFECATDFVQGVEETIQWLRDNNYCENN